MPACAYITRPGDLPRTLLVVTGLARIGTVSETGDELTLLWAHSGEWLGVAFIVEPTPRSVALPPEAFIQAVTDLTYLDIPATLVREYARSDAAVAWVIAQFLNDRLWLAVREILLYAHGDLRSRIAHRLVELALHQPPGAPLIATITQDELAKAVGAARPSVARILADLKREGHIRSVRGGLLIARPSELVEPGQHGAA